MQADLRWVIDPEFTGHGYATEAVRELVRICFDELVLRRVTAGCFADNEASWRLMERLGMRRELHAVADALHRSGEWLDTFGYAVLESEWRQTSGDPALASPVNRPARPTGLTTSYFRSRYVRFGENVLWRRIHSSAPDH